MVHILEAVSPAHSSYFNMTVHRMCICLLHVCVCGWSDGPLTCPSSWWFVTHAADSAVVFSHNSALSVSAAKHGV